MQVLTTEDTFILLCKSTRKWGMYLSFNLDAIAHPFSELTKAAPYLNEELENFYQICVDDAAIILFDTEEEMWERYYQTVGDDGPTKLNNYNGPLRVYALTCDPDGYFLAENT